MCKCRYIISNVGIVLVSCVRRNRRGERNRCAPTVPIVQGGQAVRAGDERQRQRHQDQVR